MEGITFYLILSACLLGHSDFFVREKAGETLSYHWPASHSALLWAENSNDPEARNRAALILDARCKSLLGRNSGIALFVGSFAGMPYSDSLPGLQLHGYLDRARNEMVNRGLACGGPMYYDYRLATKLWLESEGPPDPVTLGLMQYRTWFWNTQGRYP